MQQKIRRNVIRTEKSM